MKELLNALPDDRPVTALCLISDPTKCPADYTVVAKSYDQDLDADLWKDRIFGKHTTRYLCLSKSEVPAGFVIDSLCIINEKDIPPNGYVVLSKTYGSEQKAWRKRQLCYRLAEKSSVFLAVTDIIILSKAKKAPDGFTLAGEINGLVICYKSAPLPAEPTASPNLLPYQKNLKPTAFDQPSSLRSNSPSRPNVPTRPAPTPSINPSPNSANNKKSAISSGTLSGFTGLEGVPFGLSSQIQCSSSKSSSVVGRIRHKTPQELNTEFSYSFSNEREAMMRL